MWGLFHPTMFCCAILACFGGETEIALHYARIFGLTDLITRFTEEHPDCIRQLFCVDGNGFMHPRGCGRRRQEEEKRGEEKR
jgi:hypothetical protein